MQLAARHPIFPNPVIADEFKIQFNTEQGVYRIDIMDANGRIIKTRSVFVTGMKSFVEMQLEGVIAKGVLLVRVIGKADKNIFSEKIIVQ